MLLADDTAPGWAIALTYVIFLTACYGPVTVEWWKRRWWRRHTTWVDVIERSSGHDDDQT